jgi:hypothetical protein
MQTTVSGNSAAKRSHKQEGSKAAEKIAFCKKQALHRLNELRNGAPAYEGDLDALKVYLEKGRLTFADIGTNSNEIEELRIKSYKIAAQHYLTQLREQMEATVMHVINIRTHLEEAYLTPEDIGTSEQELASFEAKLNEDSLWDWLSNE